MDFAEAWKLISKEKALSEQLKRLADGTWATMRLHVWSIWGASDQIGFYWQRRSDAHERKLAFSVPASECLDKTDEEIAVLVEKHIPGYAEWLARGRAERKRRQAIRVKENNRRISERRQEQRKKKCDICGAPIVAERSSKHYCSARCRQKAHRRWADESATSTGRKKQHSRIES